MSVEIAIVGYGNVGKGVHRAIERNEDMHLGAIVSRDPKRVLEEVQGTPIFAADDHEIIDGDLAMNTDVAILCGGSKEDLPQQGPYFAQFFNTVDSFDTHVDIPKYFAEMDTVALESGTVSVISAGWDPGTFSLERTLASAFIPGAKTYAFYGLTEKGGVSQGHSDAIRKLPGVADARQYTHAYPAAMERVRKEGNPDLSHREIHWRECYVVLEEGADEAEVAEAIKTMEFYFEPFNTEVEFISQAEMDRDLSDMPHDGVVITRGETGNGNRAIIEYRNEWESNPEATGSILVAHARAAYRLSKDGVAGAFTILDFPPSYLSPRSDEELRKDFL